MARRRTAADAGEPLHLSAMEPAIGDNLDLGDEDVDELDNPDIEDLSDAPVIGSRSLRSDLFGESAETFGRATSPKLYAQAGRMPTAVQYRVWKWENGIPVGLGVIDTEATEEDFVRTFASAMPRKGEGRAQFKMRPIDIRGAELGKEFTLTISEHHATLAALRASDDDDRERNYRDGRGDVYVNGGGAADATMAEEMGRMFESAVENAERRTELLQSTLEQERERLRMEEAKRAEERVNMAERSADVVQKMTEKLMASDRLRAEEAMRGQRDQGQLMMSTLTSVFAQQQQAAREQHDRMREADMARLAQDREFFERQRQEMELRRASEREEEDRRRRYEREEWERKRELEKAELASRLERERMEMEIKRMEIEKERDRVRVEIEEKRRAEREEWERRAGMEREERERRERLEREKWERERMEWERKEALRREELQRETLTRQEGLVTQQRQLELAAQRDREHAERLADMARLEREAQREALAARERGDREAREAAERERARQHDLQIKEMELSKERDREHAERMIQLTKAQNSGGLSGLTDMLGMDTPELLGKIFGGGAGGDGEGGGKWAEAIPAVLAALGTALAPKQREEPATPDLPPGTAMVQTPNGPRLISVNALAGMAGAPQRTPITVPRRPLPNLPEQGMLPPGATEDEASAPVSEAPAPAAAPEKPADDTPPEYAAAEGLALMGRARDAGVPLSKQRVARKAIRELIEEYASSPEESWTEKTAGAVMKQPLIIDYLSAVGVWAALVEAKTDPGLSARIVKALKASGMADALPFTEEDVAAKASKKED